MKHTILITGGAGFIGNNLTRYLLDHGENVVIIDNFISSNRDKITDLLSHPNFSLWEGDICKDNIFNGFQYKIKQIYHLACPASPPKYQAHPLKTIDTCVNGTINILEFAKKENCSILFTSTSEVYGESLVTPQSESYRGNVNTIGIRACYDEGKRLAETIMFEYRRQFGLDIKVVRIFNTYGPYMDEDDGRIVTNFIKQVRDDKEITIYGTGKQTRSFCFIDDLIRGLVLMMASQHTGPINLGNPNEMSIFEIAYKISKIFGKELRIKYYPLPQDDPTHRCPDISLAKKLLNWEPKINIDEGLNKTIN
jgi:UDP-glucuronate decarboxylase